MKIKLFIASHPLKKCTLFIFLLPFKKPMVWSSLAIFSDGRVDQVRDLK
jgi:hypothetical protein